MVPVHPSRTARHGQPEEGHAGHPGEMPLMEEGKRVHRSFLSPAAAVAGRPAQPNFPKSLYRGCPKERAGEGGQTGG